ncbi:hypothetical protein [Caballeronia sp. LZ043]|uniref:hypothetical protein n=1 Tax=Caballeronia sp. LZ043 TaxID=3038569 RepID=UPI002857338E|nr:hypothetical protein [Caballeronia sp. LZ043]MDR5819670.1 hypothetical protein [Caballeronia sp. LZ043]
MISVSSDYSRSTQTAGGSSDTSDDPPPAQQPSQDAQASSSQDSDGTSASGSAQTDSASETPQKAPGSTSPENTQDGQTTQNSQAPLPTSTGQDTTGQRTSGVGTQQQLSLEQPLPDAQPGANSGSSTTTSGTQQTTTDKPADAMNSRDLAGSLIWQNDLAAAGDRFDSAVDDSMKDVKDGKDTTDHVIAAGKALDDVQDIMGQDKLNSEQQDKSDRLAKALDNRKDNDTLESLGKNANVDLKPLAKDHNLDNFNKYGKYPSIIARSTLFDEGRFNNSQVLKNWSWLSKYQTPGQSRFDWMGPKGRLAVLLGSRMLAATNNFTKAGSMFMSGIQKLKDGKDPTDDFIGGGASMGQGLNEVTVGAGTDLGNHAAKQWQLKQAQAARTEAASNPNGTSPAQDGSNTNGTSTQQSGPSTSADDTRSIQSLNEQVDTDLGRVSGDIDGQVTGRQNELQKSVFDRLESTHPDNRRLILQRGVSEVFPEYNGMAQLGDQIKKAAKEDAQSAHENLKKIESDSQAEMQKLHDLGFETVDAARKSENAAALESVSRLDNLGQLKHDAYDQFDRAMNEREALMKDAPASYRELGQALNNLDPEVRQSKLSEWMDSYGKKFTNYQDTFLAHTDAFPDWFKISKPLRTQLVPSLIGTAFGALGFGASLDSYLKKQQAGTLTTQDKINLGAQVFNLVGGIVGFVPFVGPVASIIATVIGGVMGGIADGYQGYQLSEAQNDLLNKYRDQWNNTHSQADQIWDGFDGG